MVGSSYVAHMVACMIVAVLTATTVAHAIRTMVVLVAHRVPEWMCLIRHQWLNTLQATSIMNKQALKRIGVDMDYSHRYYKTVTVSRKRHIINRQLDELHEMQLDMIDAAVDASDLHQAKEIIEWIQSR